jgi:hypothetical protein
MSLGSFSKQRILLKQAVFNGKGHLENVVFWLWKSEIAWPKTIPLSSAYCINFVYLNKKKFQRQQVDV